MGLLITNGTCSTTRDGASPPLTNVRVFVDTQSLHFTPEGPAVTSDVLFDNGLDLANGDHITVTQRDNQPLYPVTTQQIILLDFQFDVIKATVLGGL